jgi:hypothetical protein
MEGHQPRYSWKLFALLVLGGAGLGLFAVGVTGHTASWLFIAFGLGAVVVSLLGLWILQTEQIKAASKTRSRKRDAG